MKDRIGYKGYVCMYDKIDVIFGQEQMSGSLSRVTEVDGLLWAFCETRMQRHVHLHLGLELEGMDADMD